MRSKAKKRLASFKKQADPKDAAYDFIGNIVNEAISKGVVDYQNLILLVNEAANKKREELEIKRNFFNEEARENGLKNWKELFRATWFGSKSYQHEQDLRDFSFQNEKFEWMDDDFIREVVISEINDQRFLRLFSD